MATQTMTRAATLPPVRPAPARQLPATRRWQEHFAKVAGAVVTLAAIATMLQIGYTSPVAAAGIPRPLNRNARDTFCTIFR